MISEAANRRIAAFENALALNGAARPEGTLYSGVDLGTAYIVTAVVDGKGQPVAGMLTRSGTSVRDGLVLDYVGAVHTLRKQVVAIRNAGFDIRTASAAYPPGISGRNTRAFGNVVESAGLELAGLIDEPTAASLVLDIADGAVVDIGGGTTGISVIQDGEVVYAADEPTGGIHLDLVIAGHFHIDVQEAERLKTDPVRQQDLFPMVRPVFQKMAGIVLTHLREHPVKTLYLVGGTSQFPGIESVMREETGLNTALPEKPLLVTPLGIALSCSGKTVGAAPRTTEETTTE